MESSSYGKKEFFDRLHELEADDLDDGPTLASASEKSRPKVPEGMSKASVTSTKKHDKSKATAKRSTHLETDSDSKVANIQGWKRKRSSVPSSNVLSEKRQIFKNL